ncbi:hypothetical protein ACWT_4422 [Actinoplanes sp. SE50]|nr:MULTISPECIES: hypothetical protein [unclassified Actinoplanes]AEV85444.1 hypothetical protein ACPL_4553 [Actinoplanes sp. SE50/110]ATO83837.1 hypothetical protein ACWT_4422 [Actinoplanes sp. SE50]SLM01247.1 hypothetical protein ACSP50_4483 [Actinoplanes sp. SE50/110]
MTADTDPATDGSVDLHAFPPAPPSPIMKAPWWVDAALEGERTW